MPKKKPTKKPAKKPEPQRDAAKITTMLVTRGGRKVLIDVDGAGNESNKRPNGS